MLIEGVFVDRGSFCFGVHRLHLGASLMYFFYLAYDLFILYGLYMLGGDTMFYIYLIVSCFTCATLIIDLYYEVIHGICLLFSVL